MDTANENKRFCRFSDQNQKKCVRDAPKQVKVKQKKQGTEGGEEEEEEEEEEEGVEEEEERRDRPNIIIQMTARRFRSSSDK